MFFIFPSRWFKGCLKPGLSLCCSQGFSRKKNFCILLRATNLQLIEKELSLISFFNVSYLKSSFTLTLGCCNLQCFEQASPMDIYRGHSFLIESNVKFWSLFFSLMILKVLQYFLYMNNYTLSSQYGSKEKKLSS